MAAAMMRMRMMVMINADASRNTHHLEIVISLDSLNCVNKILQAVKEFMLR